METMMHVHNYSLTWTHKRYMSPGNKLNMQTYTIKSLKWYYAQFPLQNLVETAIYFRKLT